MRDRIPVRLPVQANTLEDLRSGDMVSLTGRIYGARDAAHKRLVEAIDAGQQLPIDLNNQTIYYVGPAPARAGHVIGPAGPTTSGRMDVYTVPLLQLGVKVLIGKGYRAREVKEALLEHRSVYLAAVGGAAALLARHITASKVIAYEDLGPEAIHELMIADFPCIVVHDIYGGDAYTRQD
ncbi:MAG: FumA C-terminus/TtdB family hydratase beta subunit [Trueperaceae bacterium]